MSPEFSFVALTAGIAALWQHFQAFMNRLRAVFITRAQLQGPVAAAVTAYLFHQGKVLNWGDRRFTSHPAYVRPLESVANVVWETSPIQPLLVWIHGRPCLFHCPGHPQMDGMATISDTMISLTSLRGLLDVTALTRAALEFTRLRETTGHRYFVRRVNGEGARDQISNASAPPAVDPRQSAPGPHERFLHWSPDEIGPPRPESPFAAHALDLISARARTEFRQWLALKPWYQARSIPWRRGFLFHGPPGTGKTSLARCLAQEADMPIFVFDLSTLCNDEFCMHWRDMQRHAPCLALIEDIDGVFHGRVNVLAQGPTPKGGFLTFDCLLNNLGGVETADGVFTIITTNHPETLDPALVRPGRIDSQFEIPLPGPEQRAHILRRILGTAEQTDLNATHGQTAAAVTDYAVVKAMQQIEHTYATAA